MNKVHIVAVLDRSGSMAGSETEVINAYNNMVVSHRKLSRESNTRYTTTLILFDDKVSSIYSKLDIDATPTLDKYTYTIGGMTALYDAIELAMRQMEGEQKVIFFIETDGQENASREVNLSQLKRRISDKTEAGWDFNFVGAGLPAADTKAMGTSLGIGKTLSFNKSEQGYATRNESFLGATRAYSQS